MGGDDVLQVRRLSPHRAHLVKNHLSVGVIQRIDECDALAVIQQERMNVPAHSLAQIVNAISKLQWSPLLFTDWPPELRSITHHSPTNAARTSYWQTLSSLPCRFSPPDAR